MYFHLVLCKSISKYVEYIEELYNHYCLHLIMESKFKQWWSTILLMLTKRTTTSRLKILNTRKKTITYVSFIIHYRSKKEPFILIILPHEFFPYFDYETDFQACFQSDTIVVSCRQPPYCLYWLYKKVHRVMNGSKTKKFIELWTNLKQTRDSALVQSKCTKTIHINSTRFILLYSTGEWGKVTFTSG